MKCESCGRQIPPAEAVAYRNRCEDCWCSEPKRTDGKGSAQCFGDKPLGSMQEVSTQGPKFRRRHGR